MGTEITTKSASTNDVDKAGNSSLHLALLLQNSDIADIILACMSNEHDSVDLENRNGLTHLHVAAARGNAAVVGKLIYSGADLVHLSTVARPRQEVHPLHQRL